MSRFLPTRYRSAPLAGLLACMSVVAAPVLAQDAAAVPPAAAASTASSVPPAPNYDAMPATSAGYASSGRDSYSLLPYTRRGYVGLNLGQTRFDMVCGVYPCDDHSNVSVNLYTGGMFNDWLGLELGYVHTGNLDRLGGTTSAQGVDLLLVGRVPLGSFNLFAKAGGIYGRTKVTTNPFNSDLNGSKSGGGLSVAAGVGYDFTPTSGVVLEWSRNKFKFVNEGHPNVDMAQVGYVHRF